jgi:hypothetical protein
MIRSRRSVLTTVAGLTAAALAAPVLAGDSPSGGRRPRTGSEFCRHHEMVQLGAALDRRFAGQGGAGRFLDLWLLQLRQHAALRDQALRDIQGQGACRGRHPYPRISIRTVGRQCAGCPETAWYHLSGGTGQRVGDLECLAQSVLAGPIYRRPARQRRVQPRGRGPI